MSDPSVRQFAMPGLQVTDEVTYSDHVLWDMGVQVARIKRGPLRAYVPSMALIDPWPEEFLWRPFKLLGVVDAWMSMLRALRYPERVELSMQTADRCHLSSVISRDLVADTAAFESLRKHHVERFLLGYQEALDKKELAGDDEFADEDILDGRR